METFFRCPDMRRSWCFVFDVGLCNTWRWDIQQRKSSLDMFRTPYLMINTDIKRVKHSWRLCYLQPPGFMKQTIEITLACSRRYLIRFCQHSHSNTRTVKVAVQTAHKPWGYWSLCCILLWAKPGADPSFIMFDPLSWPVWSWLSMSRYARSEWFEIR